MVLKVLPKEGLQRTGAQKGTDSLQPEGGKIRLRELPELGSDGLPSEEDVVRMSEEEPAN